MRSARRLFRESRNRQMLPKDKIGHTFRLGTGGYIGTQARARMRSQAVRVIGGGKLVIPASFRRELGIDVGDTVVVEMADGELHIRSLSASVRRAQGIIREFVPEGIGLVDQLLEDRRKQAGSE